MPPRKTAPPIVPATDPPPTDTPPPTDAPPKKYGNHGNLPGPGPGRPRKAGPPRNESQHALAAVVVSAEARLDAARVTFAKSSLVADELELYLAQIGMASAQAAYMRSQNNHMLALKKRMAEAEVRPVSLSTSYRQRTVRAWHSGIT